MPQYMLTASLRAYPFIVALCARGVAPSRQPVSVRLYQRPGKPLMNLLIAPLSSSSEVPMLDGGEK